MKVLELTDYIKLFIGALQYDKVGLIAEYFKGKYEEHKECNPLPLFNDGIEKAYKFFANSILNEFNKEHMEYRQYQRICKKDGEDGSDIDEPNVNNYCIPLRIDGQIVNYSLEQIEFIKEGYDFIAKKDKIINEGLTELANELIKKLPFVKSTVHEGETRKMSNEQLIQSLIDDGFIDDNVRDNWRALLSGNLTITINWKDSDWILFLIIEKLIEANYLNITKDEIFTLLEKRFTFKKKSRKANVIKDNYKRAEKQKTPKFTTKQGKINNFYYKIIEPSK